jgi:2-polyprenyl-6-methoxyphenol hydroxylase-like FAD-dependent oxidoreductase
MFHWKSHRHSTEVLVVGAGPVGMAAGIFLSERGIPFTIMDEEWRSAQHNYALTLHSSTLKLLSEIGLVKDVLENGCRIDTIGLYEGGVRHAEIRFSDLKTEYPFLVVLPQSFLEEILERRLKERGTEISWNRQITNLEFTEESVKAKIEELGEESCGYAIATSETVVDRESLIDARFVIGADGHDSQIRRSLELPFDSVGPAELYAVMEFETAVLPRNEMRILFSGSKSGVIWPIPGKLFRGMFRLNDDDFQTAQNFQGPQYSVTTGNKSYPNLPERIALEIVEKHAPSLTGTIPSITWSIVARFEQRLARSFGSGRSWLCGDAVHTAGPIGVQSTNAGFREAYDLVSAISQIRSGESLDRLDKYGHERLVEWRQMRGLDTNVEIELQENTWVADHKSEILKHLPGTGPEIEQLLALLHLKLTKNSDDLSDRKLQAS